MNRSTKNHLLKPASIPRMRGDEPAWKLDVKILMMYSPHARG